MKKLFILIFLLTSIKAFSQEVVYDEIRTLFNGQIRKVSGFFSPYLEFGTVDKYYARFTGGGACILFNNNFYIGGFGTGKSTSIYSSDSSKLTMGHGGFWIGGVFKTQKILHFGASLQMGWGSAKLKDRTDNILPEKFDYDNYNILIPSVEMEVNLTHWFKVTLGLQQRIIFGIHNLSGYKSSDLSKTSISLGFKLGWF